MHSQGISLSVLLGVFLLGAVLFPGAATGQATGGSDLTDKEQKFVELMKDSVLYGTFRLTVPNGLTDATDEAYTIKGVRKIHGNNWSVECRIEYGKTDVTVPIPIKLYWVEDTPVISVTDLMVPGIGVYTSRVQVYRGCYAGTWFGKGYGGTLSGRVLKKSEYEALMKAKSESAKKSEGL